MAKDFNKYTKENNEEPKADVSLEQIVVDDPKDKSLAKRNLFLVEFPEALNIQSHLVKSVSPFCLFSPDKKKQLTIRYVEPVVNSLKGLEGCIFDFRIRMLDEKGKTIRVFKFVECTLAYSMFDSLDYAVNELSIVSLFIEYNKVEISNE